MAKQSAALSFDSEHRLRSENLSFDIDVWYPKLKDFTFESIFIPLKRSEAESILAFHDYSWRNCTKILSAKNVEILQDLENAIDITIQALLVCDLMPDTSKDTAKSTNKSTAAFIRLCGRSPKDGEPLNREEIKENYRTEMASLLSQNFPDNANTKMIAIARTPYMKINSGKEAMSLLLTSERVMAEMIDWLKFGEPEQLCIRKYEPELSLDYEFRCFIYNGQMTAISQYDHYSYFPYLEPIKVELLIGMYKLWKSIHHLVCDANSSYVIDIAYLKASNKFMLVELSPFTPCTGPALFHWQFDKLILQGIHSGVAVTIPDGVSADSTDAIAIVCGSSATVTVGVDCADISAGDNTTSATTTTIAVSAEATTATAPADTISVDVLSNLLSSACPTISDRKNGDSMDGLNTEDLVALSRVTFRLKREEDLHPQLGELVEINWDMRWQQEKIPYYEYYTKAEEERQNIVAAAALEEEQAKRRNSSGGKVLSSVWSFLTGKSVASVVTDNTVTAVGTTTATAATAAESVITTVAATTDDVSTTLTDTAASEPAASSTAANASDTITSNNEPIYLFVYGTLKSGFHWNNKYLHERLNAKCVAKQVSAVNKYALVIGDSGVPYLLGDVKEDGSDSSLSQQPLHHIIGEVWQIDSDLLKGLDEYEGLSKGYYSRILIPVTTNAVTTTAADTATEQPDTAQTTSAVITEAFVYILNESTAELRAKEFIPEYTLSAHRALYKPIKHIQVKQYNYFVAPSNWGKTTDSIDVMTDKPLS